MAYTDFRQKNVIIYFEVKDLTRYFTFKLWRRKAGITGEGLYSQQYTVMFQKKKKKTINCMKRNDTYGDHRRCHLVEICLFVFPLCSFVIINLTSFRLRHRVCLGWAHTLAMLLLSLCACLQCKKKKKNLPVKNISCSKWMCIRQLTLCKTGLNSGRSQKSGCSIVPPKLV